MPTTNNTIETLEQELLSFHNENPDYRIRKQMDEALDGVSDSNKRLTILQKIKKSTLGNIKAEIEKGMHQVTHARLKAEELEKQVTEIKLAEQFKQNENMLNLYLKDEPEDLESNQLILTIIRTQLNSMKEKINEAALELTKQNKNSFSAKLNDIVTIFTPKVSDTEKLKSSKESFEALFKNQQKFEKTFPELSADIVMPDKKTMPQTHSAIENYKSDRQLIADAFSTGINAKLDYNIIYQSMIVNLNKYKNYQEGYEFEKKREFENQEKQNKLDGFKENLADLLKTPFFKNLHSTIKNKLKQDIETITNPKVFENKLTQLKDLVKKFEEGETIQEYLEIFSANSIELADPLMEKLQRIAESKALINQMKNDRQLWANIKDYSVYPEYNKSLKPLNQERLDIIKSILNPESDIEVVTESYNNWVEKAETTQKRIDKINALKETIKGIGNDEVAELESAKPIIKCCVNQNGTKTIQPGSMINNLPHKMNNENIDKLITDCESKVLNLENNIINIVLLDEKTTQHEAVVKKILDEMRNLHQAIEVEKNHILGFRYAENLSGGDEKIHSALRAIQGSINMAISAQELIKNSILDIKEAIESDVLTEYEDFENKLKNALSTNANNLNSMKTQLTKKLTDISDEIINSTIELSPKRTNVFWQFVALVLEIIDNIKPGKSSFNKDTFFQSPQESNTQALLRTAKNKIQETKLASSQSPGPQ